MKLKKKPSFCLFEGTDSVPKYPQAETLVLDEDTLKNVHEPAGSSCFHPKKKPTK
jgi:hypothetical protein